MHNVSTSIATAALALVFTSSLTLDAPAQDARDVGTWPVGVCYAVACNDSLVVWTCGAQLRISRRADDGFPPELLSTLPLLNRIPDVELSGDLAFLAMWESGIAAVDIADPIAPRILSVYAPGESFHRICVQGDLLYTCTDGSVFNVLDYAAPDQPELVGQLVLGAGAGSTAVRGNLAYVTGSGGLSIVDVSDPAAPVLVATHGNVYGGPPRLLGDEYLITKDYVDGVLVWDVSDLDSVSAVSQVTLPGYFTTSDMAISGSRCAVTQAVYGVFIIDFTDPFAPVITGQHDSVSFDAMLGCALDGSALFAMEGEGLKSLRVDASGVPYLLAYQRVPTSTRHGAVEGDLIAIASYRNAMSLLDISDPAQPTPLAILHRDDHPEAVALHAPYAYLGTSEGLRIFDVSDPAAPIKLGSLDFERYFQDLEYRDDYVYAASWNGGLTVIDVSDPNAPAITSEHAVGRGEGLYLADEYLFLAADDDGILVYRFDDPSEPTYCAAWEGEGIEDVVLVGEVLYASCGSHLLVLDASDPCDIELISSIDGGAFHLGVCGDRMLVTGVDRLARVFDIGYPAFPVEVGMYEARSDDSYVFGDGRYVYHAGYYAALEILDVSGAVAVEQPTLTISGVSSSVRIDIDGMHAALAEVKLTVDDRDGRRELVLELTGSGRASAVDSRAWSVGEVERSYALWRRVTASRWDIVARQSFAPGVLSAARIDRASPNPFNPQVTIQYTLVRSEDVVISVFDLKGRRIRTLRSDTQLPGRHEVTWDGRDDRRASCSSGRYVIALATPTVYSTASVTLVR